MNADFPPPEKNCIQVHANFPRRRKVRVHSSIQTTVYAGASEAPKVGLSSELAWAVHGIMDSQVGTSSRKNNTSTAPEDFDCHCQLKFWLESAIYCRFLFHNSLPHIPRSCIQSISLGRSFSLQLDIFLPPPSRKAFVRIATAAL